MTTPLDSNKMNQIIAAARQEKEQRQKTYRERALKMYPWICAHCGREFSGKRLRELTVHHKDHNHDNNPPDGSNWELLCIYCHDNEHSRNLESEWHDGPTTEDNQESSSIHNPFANLDALIKGKK